MAKKPSTYPALCPRPEDDERQLRPLPDLVAEFDAAKAETRKLQEQVDANLRALASSVGDMVFNLGHLHARTQRAAEDAGHKAARAAGKRKRDATNRLPDRVRECYSKLRKANVGDKEAASKTVAQFSERTPDTIRRYLRPIRNK